MQCLSLFITLITFGISTGISTCFAQNTDLTTFSDQPNNEKDLNKDQKQISESVGEKAQCGEFEDFGYCFYPGNGKRSHELIYFLHGFSGSKHTWEKNKNTLLLESYWKDSKEGSPSVVGISYGPMWVLSPNNSRGLSGLLDSWTEERFQKMESEIVKFTPVKRFILGESMGGHNSLMIYNKLPRLFDKISLLCPAQLMNSPLIPVSEIRRVLPEVDSIWPAYIGAMGMFALYYDQPTWDSESPFNFSETFLKSIKNMRMVLLDFDYFGFTKVNQTWIEKVTQLGGNIDYQMQKGVHCVLSDMTYVDSFLR